MKHTLYLECSSGISGDMTVAALLDLGADQQVLEAALASLPVSGYEVTVSRVKKSGLDVCDFNVQLDKEHENHDHDMDYLHGKEGHVHHHHHSSSRHHHGEDHHRHTHRGLSEILEILNQGALTPRARELAQRIFMILAEAEAKAHGISPEEVHFHEVGAVDSIVDIVATAVCLDYLDISNVVIPYLNEGYGFVRCQHGVIPIPVPATLNIVNSHGLTLHLSNVEGELVTPTGAAIAAAIKTADHLPTRFRVIKTGIGAGKRHYERPSLLRAMLIEDTSSQTDGVWKLESDLDDCSGEALGYVLEQLMQAGTLDVHYTPIYMKKNRPAWEITILCTEDKRTVLEEILFRETTTIGIRRVWMERSVLPRTLRTVETPWGSAQVKICTIGGDRRTYPEYESVSALARQSGRSYQEVYQTIQDAANCQNE